MDIAAHFAETYAFIEAAREAEGAVLVHCHEGKSRSVTLTLAYLMESQARCLMETGLSASPWAYLNL